MTAGLTLMCVHAHPDDEAISTGGVLARYASEGVETVLVTCTNGELGDGPDGVKPGEPGHTPSDVVVRRRAELQESCRALGVAHLELLGYHDSGMMGWATNDAPDSFWHTDVASAAGRLASLMVHYRPQVVVTYDPHGFYGHPDHIQAHRITVAAIDLVHGQRPGGGGRGSDPGEIASKLYYPAVPVSWIARFGSVLSARGVDVPAEIADAPFGTPDDQIGAVVDCAGFAAQKYASLSAHASQAENIFFLSLGEPMFAEVFQEEAFVRARDGTGAEGVDGVEGVEAVETDLFAGLR